MPPGRLNVFQRLARTWDAAHPYNAGQACRVAGAFDAAAVVRAWNETLQALGLGAVWADGRHFGFRPVPRQGVYIPPEGTDLAGHFTRELNRPFGDPHEPPFRPFAHGLGGSTWLGVAYQHWVADSVSVRAILRDWVERLTRRGAGAGAAPPAARKQLTSAGPAWGEWPDVPAVLALLRRYGEYRRVRKVHTMGPLDYPVRVRLVEAPPALVPGLLAYARSRGVTLNDVLLAALAEACDGLVPAQHRSGRRDLAVSAVVDLRPWMPPNERDAFGCLLGFMSVVCRPRASNDWDGLLRAVAAQTSRHRGPTAAAGPPGVLWMRAAELASRFTPPGRVYDFYRKEAPFAGGISNVNLNGTWFAPARHAPRVLEYLRVSPTGPMVPLAVNVTTLGDELRVSMTYRSNLFNDWTAAELAAAFTRRLARVAGRC